MLGRWGRRSRYPKGLRDAGRIEIEGNGEEEGGATDGR